MERYLSKDLASYQSVSVIEAKAYLLAKGWKISEKIGEKGLLLSSPNGKQTVILPLKESFADYSLRLTELVHVVAEMEEREDNKILHDIKLSGFDIFKIRLIDNAESGSIPINSTEKIVDDARKMLVSVANSCVKARRVFGMRPWKEVEEYIHNVRLGQTEQGSYIFNLLTPIAPEIHATLPLPFDQILIQSSDPFARKVTEKLSDAIDAIYTAAQNTKTTSDMSAFEAAVDTGVSANFCEALSGITKEAGSAEFSVSWATVRPVAPVHRREPQKFTIKTAEIIEEAARKFREIEPRPDTLIKGYVSGLDKEKRDPLGNVTLKGLLDGRLCSVKLSLSDAEYDLAIKAHKGFKAISVEGELIQRGKFKTLDKVRNFFIEQDDD